MGLYEVTGSMINLVHIPGAYCSSVSPHIEVKRQAKELYNRRNIPEFHPGSGRSSVEESRWIGQVIYNRYDDAKRSK